MAAWQHSDEIRQIVSGMPAQKQAILERCIAIQQIPAPTFAETPRAEFIEQTLRELGLRDVSRDEVDNVFGRIAGQGLGRALLLSAHTDTVFPQETDLTLTRDDRAGKLCAPGIGDNSLGVAALVTLAEQLRATTPPVDIWLVANTGEEGVGDLRGMRVAVDTLQDRIGASVVIEGMGLGRIVHQALGSRRYRIAVRAPGGHSWSQFGSPSAIHVLVQLADRLARLEVPLAPRTTFNIGRIQGGTSVNTIAENAWLELDLRSEDANALARLIEQVHAIARRFQTHAWRERGVSVAVEVIGDRPVGEIAATHPLVRAAQEALRHAGLPVEAGDQRSSTDSNIPLSRGIPSVCVGVSQGGNAHRLDEWISTAEVVAGVQHLVYLTAAAADMQKV